MCKTRTLRLAPSAPCFPVVFSCSFDRGRLCTGAQVVNYTSCRLWLEQRGGGVTSFPKSTLQPACSKTRRLLSTRTRAWRGGADFVDDFAYKASIWLLWSAVARLQLRSGATRSPARKSRGALLIRAATRPARLCPKRQARPSCRLFTLRCRELVVSARPFLRALPALLEPFSCTKPKLRSHS